MAPEHLEFWKSRAQELTPEELAKKITNDEETLKADPELYPDLIAFVEERLPLLRAELASRQAA